MIDTLFKKSLEQFSVKSEAVALGLIGFDEIGPTETYLAIELAEKRKVAIPDKFMKDMSLDNLFHNLPRKEIIQEILVRSAEKDFTLPTRDLWDTFKVPLRLQKALFPHFVKLERKELKKWKKALQPKITRQIVSARIKTGQKNRKTKKEDSLLTAIKNSSLSHLDYFNLTEITKERFKSVLEYWLKAEDSIKAKIFKTNYVHLLTESQYIDVLKSWLSVGYSYSDLKELKLEIFEKLPDEFQYKALEKFIRSSIDNINPMPTPDKVKQIILPKLFSSREDAEKLYLQYKIRYLQNELDKFKNGTKLKGHFTSREIKQFTVIKKGIRKVYHHSIDELKFIVEIFEWITTLEGKRKEAVATFFLNQN